MLNYNTLLFSKVYPTNIRGLGLGMASAMARIGCIVTPFLAQVRKQFHFHYF